MGQEEPEVGCVSDAAAWTGMLRPPMPAAGFTLQPPLPRAVLAAALEQESFGRRRCRCSDNAKKQGARNCRLSADADAGGCVG